jgi:elongation factor Ts
MEIAAKLVKDLRESTGAGMMKCKEALVKCNGNFEEAVDYLRKKGLASADNKSGRATSQGLIVIAQTPDLRTAAIVEVNCETDFVARNEGFQAFARTIVETVLNTPAIKTVADLEQTTLPTGEKIEETRKNLISKTGENMAFGRLERLAMPSGTHGLYDQYVHGDGNIGVIVNLTTSTPELAQHPAVKALAHEVALQVAAMKARYTTRSEVPRESVERERNVILGQIQNDPKNAGKPQNILEKIVEGRVDKYFKEYCLVEQLYIKDDSKTILALVDETAKKLGGTVSVAGFRRWEIGQIAQEQTPQATENKEACCGSSSCCQ